MKNSSFTLRSTIAAVLFLWAAAAPGAVAQETRAQDAKGIHWKLCPPIEGVPCPSRVAAPDAPKELVFGTFKLATPARVTDGDTIHVEGLKESLRCIGLDAEETFKDPGKKRLADVDWNEYVRTETAGHDVSRPPKYGTPMGEAAKDCMKQLLEGVTEVRLEWDEEQRKIDMYGRHLVIVLCKKDGEWMNLNVEMIRQGLSPYFVKYGRARRGHERYVEAQKEAQAHERGIWSDPGLFRHYPDYGSRLVWWNERAEAIALAEKLRTERNDLMILGRDDDWERLKGFAGKKVTVFGTPLAAIPKKDLVLLPLSHRRGLDFMIVGSEAEIARLAPKKEEGNLLFVTGEVEIFKGQPQFRAKTVTCSKAPPGGAESGPAAR
jgi:endonuclease YncB( thermonuclease family)